MYFDKMDDTHTLVFSKQGWTILPENSVVYM